MNVLTTSNTHWRGCLPVDRIEFLIMVVVCWICFDFAATTVKKVIRHMGSVHSHDASFRVTCVVLEDVASFIHSKGIYIELIRIYLHRETCLFHNPQVKNCKNALLMIMIVNCQSMTGMITPLVWMQNLLTLPQWLHSTHQLVPLFLK